MTGHFVTACGCERWIPNLLGPDYRYYRIPIPGVARYEEPMSRSCYAVSSRLFEAVEVDWAKGLIEYKEVVD